MQEASETGGIWAIRNPVWGRARFGSIEELISRVKSFRPDAAWEADQLSPGALKGSIASTSFGAVKLTCSRVKGDFVMRGPVSRDGLTFGLAVAMDQGSQIWMQPMESGAAAIYQPNAENDALYRGSSSYVTVDIPPDALDMAAARAGLGIGPARLDKTGKIPGVIDPMVLDTIRRQVAGVHRGHGDFLPPGLRLDELVLAGMLEHFGRQREQISQMPQGGYGRIVARARAYVEAHIDAPIGIDDMAAAAFTSRRTLHRAFAEVIGDTPQSYVLKIRLNRIRQELASDDEARRTVTTVAHHWGIPELGRLASRYREQFGELPSQTLARRLG